MSDLVGFFIRIPEPLARELRDEALRTGRPLQEIATKAFQLAGTERRREKFAEKKGKRGRI